MQVSLRPYHPEYRDAFCGWCTVQAAFDFLRKSVPSSSSPADLFDHFCATARDTTPGRWVWAIVEDESGALAGHLEVKATARTRAAEGELIYFVGAQHRRRGVASAAVVQLTGSRAVVPGVRSLVAFCRPTNEASIAVLKHAEFALVPERSSGDALCFARDVAPTDGAASRVVEPDGATRVGVR